MIKLCPVIKDGRYTARYEVIESPNTFERMTNRTDPKIGTRGTLTEIAHTYPDARDIQIDHTQGRDHRTGEAIEIETPPTCYITRLQR